MRLARTAVALSLIVGTGGAVRADQLAWIPRDQAEAAVARLPAGSIVVAYCSMCDERPQVWSVDRASAVQAADGEHFEVRIDGRRLAHARRLVTKGSYAEPQEYVSLAPRRVRENVDLAYLYVHEAGNRYRVLGEILGLPCEVRVHVVELPDSATTALPVPKLGLATALSLWATGGQESQDSAEDIRKHIAEKKVQVFTIVDDPEDAEVRLVVEGRQITKGQGTDLDGKPALKDFYRIAGRITVLGQSSPLYASQESQTVQPWRDAAKAFANELESFVEQRLHLVLQERLDFPAIGGTLDEMDDRWRQQLGARKAKGGAFVSVEPAGAAAAAGIQPGDVVVAIDGKKTKHAWDVARLLWERGPGARLQLKVKRDNAERTVTLTAGEP
jgi:hypothetical protein